MFICGLNPHWLFLTSRGELRTHPMLIDGDILSFVMFNNVNCPQGFLYYNKKVIVYVFISNLVSNVRRGMFIGRVTHLCSANTFKLRCSLAST